MILNPDDCGTIYADGDWAIQRWARIGAERIQLYRTTPRGWDCVLDNSSIDACLRHIAEAKRAVAATPPDPMQSYVCEAYS